MKQYTFLIESKSNTITSKLLYDIYMPVMCLYEYLNHIYDISDDERILKKNKYYLVEKLYFQLIEKYNVFDYNITFDQLLIIKKLISSNNFIKEALFFVGKDVKLQKEIINKVKNQIKLFFNKNNYRDFYAAKERSDLEIKRQKEKIEEYKKFLREAKNDYRNCFKNMSPIEYDNELSKQLINLFRKNFRIVYPLLINNLTQFATNEYDEKFFGDKLVKTQCCLGGVINVGFSDELNMNPNGYPIISSIYTPIMYLTSNDVKGSYFNDMTFVFDKNLLSKGKFKIIKTTFMG